MRKRIDNVCRNKYWDKETKTKMWCLELKFAKHDVCHRCAERREESEARRRFFPYKWNPNLVLDLEM